MQSNGSISHDRDSKAATSSRCDAVGYRSIATPLRYIQCMHATASKVKSNIHPSQEMKRQYTGECTRAPAFHAHIVPFNSSRMRCTRRRIRHNIPPQ
eukprot:7847905-Pyramimonas_sp.AAC.2